jgi:hypothetical protein
VITDALQLGFDVEIDVWWVDGFFLGHDSPEYEVEVDFLLQSGLWIHAKNIEALLYLKDRTNCFFHDVDDAVLTSNNYVWVYPGKTLVDACVCVSPEKVDYSAEEIRLCHAICSDYPIRYKDIFS